MPPSSDRLTSTALCAVERSNEMLIACSVPIPSDGSGDHDSTVRRPFVVAAFGGHSSGAVAERGPGPRPTPPAVIRDAGEGPGCYASARLRVPPSAYLEALE